MSPKKYSFTNHTHTHIVFYRHCFVVSRLFSMSRHALFSKLGSNTSCTFYRAATRKQGKRRDFQRICITFVLLYIYIRLTATESSIHSKNLALREWQPLIPLLESSTQREWGSIIEIHRLFRWIATLQCG